MLQRLLALLERLEAFPEIPDAAAPHKSGVDFCAVAGFLGLLGKGLVICRSWKKPMKLGEKSWTSGRRSDLPIRRFITWRRSWPA